MMVMVVNGLFWYDICNDSITKYIDQGTAQPEGFVGLIKHLESQRAILMCYVRSIMGYFGV